MPARVSVSFAIRWLSPTASRRFPVKARMVKGVAILAPRSGFGVPDDGFEKAVRDLLEAGNRCLVVDFSEVHLNNLRLVGLLVGFNTSYANREGKLKLCHVNARIQNILVITRLSLVFDVYATEREAVESFAPGECTDA